RAGNDASRRSAERNGRTKRRWAKRRRVFVAIAHERAYLGQWHSGKWCSGKRRSGKRQRRQQRSERRDRIARRSGTRRPAAGTFARGGAATLATSGRPIGRTGRRERDASCFGACDCARSTGRGFSKEV